MSRLSGPGCWLRKEAGRKVDLADRVNCKSLMEKSKLSHLSGPGCWLRMEAGRKVDLADRVNYEPMTTKVKGSITKPRSTELTRNH